MAKSEGPRTQLSHVCSHLYALLFSFRIKITTRQRPCLFDCESRRALYVPARYTYYHLSILKTIMFGKCFMLISQMGNLKSREFNITL